MFFFYKRTLSKASYDLRTTFIRVWHMFNCENIFFKTYLYSVSSCFHQLCWLNILRSDVLIQLSCDQVTTQHKGMLFHFRTSHEGLNLTDLPTVTLPVEPASTSTTTLTCDCVNCDEQVAVTFCIQCRDKICDTHLQVNVFCCLWWYQGTADYTRRKTWQLFVCLGYIPW